MQGRVLLGGLLLTFTLGVAPHRANETSQGSQVQALAQAAASQHARTMKINIRIGDSVLTGTLNSSKAAKDFASLLPLSLTLEDYASTEKISDLPRRLSTDGAPPGFDPSTGDITYYAPWGTSRSSTRTSAIRMDSSHLGRSTRAPISSPAQHACR